MFILVQSLGESLLYLVKVICNCLYELHTGVYIVIYINLFILYTNKYNVMQTSIRPLVASA